MATLADRELVAATPAEARDDVGEQGHAITTFQLSMASGSRSRSCRSWSDRVGVLLPSVKRMASGV